jgi:hypothetical protein
MECLLDERRPHASNGRVGPRAERMECLPERPPNASNGLAPPPDGQPTSPYSGPKLPEPGSTSRPTNSKRDGKEERSWGEIGCVVLLIMLLGTLISAAVYLWTESRTPTETAPPSSRVSTSNSRALRPGERLEIVNKEVSLVAGSSGITVPELTSTLDQTSQRSVSFELSSCQSSDVATATLDLANWGRGERGWISFNLLSGQPQEAVFSAYDTNVPLSRTFFTETMARDVRLDARALRSNSIRLVLSRPEVSQSSDCEPAIVTASDLRTGS